MDIARKPRTVAALLLAAAGIGTLTLWPAAPAGAQDNVAPAPCTGVLLADAAGDDDTGPNSIFGGPPTNATGAAPYMDLRNVFFNFKGGVLTANLQVSDLTPAIPNGSYTQEIEYVVEYDHIGETVDWLQAIYDGSAWTFQYGAIESMDIPDGLARSMPTATTGRVFTGPNGIVQIDVPAEAGAAAGAAVENVHAYTGMWMASLEAMTTTWFYSDLAPDEGDNPTYTVAACPETPAAPTTGGETPVTAPTAPTGPAQTAPTQQQQQQQAPAAITTLPFKAKAALGSARKAARKKGVSVKVSSTSTISGLVLQLKKGSKLIATGSLPSLSGNGTVKLKLRGKRLKAGRYTLVASGRVDGRSLTASQRVSFKK